MKRIPRFTLLLLVIVFALGAVGITSAQSSDPNWKPVALTFPVGYMPADFPEKRPGKLMLNKDKPAGMFIVYPKDGEDPEVMMTLLKNMTAEMFFHETKTPVVWTSVALPAHKGIDNETGTLYSASNDKMEIQLAVYARTLGATKVLYGYYGMRNKGKAKKDDADFMDATGKGVEDFDKLWKSIKLKK